MCGRFVQQRPVSEIAAIFAAEPLFEDPGGHYNVAPSQRIAAVVERPDRRRAVAPFIWALVPSWTPKDKAAPTRLFNARSESVVERAAFRGLLERHRLIVPADGFYEWRSGPKGPRQAFFIRRIDGRPLALGGLWTTWHDPDVARHVDEPLRTTTILTTSPNGLMSQIHDRRQSGGSGSGSGCDPTARFHDLGSDCHTTRIDQNKKIHSHARLLQALGFTVTLEHAAA